MQFLRQLPHLMAETGRSYVIAFLDIAKAYDSLDIILFEAMEAMGAGPGLLVTWRGPVCSCRTQPPDVPSDGYVSGK